MDFPRLTVPSWFENELGLPANDTNELTIYTIAYAFKWHMKNAMKVWLNRRKEKAETRSQSLRLRVKTLYFTAAARWNDVWHRNN